MFVLDKYTEQVVTVLSGKADNSACHFFNAKLTTEVNKGTSLEFDVDFNNQEAVTHVKEDNYIIVPYGGAHKLLIIREVSDLHEDDMIKTVYCEDASVELADEVVLDEYTGKHEIGFILGNILTDTRWKMGQVEDTYIRELQPEFRGKSVLDAIHTLASRYDVEVDFTVEVAGNRIIARKVHMKKMFGRTLGKRFEYKKDVISLKRTVNTGDIKTAIIPFGATDEETGEVLTIKHAHWQSPTNPLNKPLGQSYLEDKDATAVWGYKGDTDKMRPRWLTVTFDEITDQDELLSMAYLQLTRFNKPKISYEVKAVDLYKLLGDNDYSFETTRVGDTVTIVDHEFTPALTLTSRVVKIEQDLNDLSNSELTLGTIVETIVDKDLKTQIEELRVSVSGAVTDVDLSDIRDSIDDLNNAVGSGRWETIDEINNLIFGSSLGYHYMQNEQGIWVYDRPLDQNPTKAVAIKGGMIGLAQWDEQTQAWSVGTFIDGNSVNASMINVGYLHGDRIEAGTIKAEALEVTMRKKIEDSVDENFVRGEITQSFTVYDGQVKSEIKRIEESIVSIESQKMYRVEIMSSNGNIFKNGNIETELRAVLYSWDKNITEETDAEYFRWTRISNNPAGDEEWNTANFGGKKSVIITSDDVQARATFQVDVVDANGKSILS